ncbi:hypothetical protein METP3_00663 [Methanosarcinales archaeon]|nr:hypothetical protein METP3_00663 [Methanosarcinales archaeon]
MEIEISREDGGNVTAELFDEKRVDLDLGMHDYNNYNLIDYHIYIEMFKYT